MAIVKNSYIIESVNEIINSFKDEYKEKIKENDYFARGFLFALHEVQQRLLKQYSIKEDNSCE